MTSVAPVRRKPEPLDDASMDKLKRRLSKAKTTLILEHPFIGNIAIGMPFEFNYAVPTACTNGKRVIFNPHFMNAMDDDECVAVVAHECFHPMFEHTFRRGIRHPYRWNMAGDYVINQFITDERIGRLPKGVLYDPDLYKKGGGTTEGIYDLLPEMPDDETGGYGGPGQPLDECEDGGGSPAEVAQQIAEWKVRVAQAAQAARMAGKLSAGAERLVGEMLTAKVNWREVMRRFMERCKSDSRTWARFNRRFLPQDIYMPAIGGETMGEVVFAVDCSGSISPQEVDQFASEIRVVKDDLRPIKLHVLYFDSSVSHYESYESDDSLDIKPHGGGGTAFSPVFREIDKRGIQPVACVFLTDLWCSDFGPQPDYPVLWVSNAKDTAPWGEVVMMEGE